MAHSGEYYFVKAEMAKKALRARSQLKYNLLAVKWLIFKRVSTGAAVFVASTGVANAKS